MLLSYVEKAAPELVSWVEKNVSFPNSMVDRITPATSPTDISHLLETSGIEDAWPVVCEPFKHWVIEDDFIAGRPAWETVGAQFVEDVVRLVEEIFSRGRLPVLVGGTMMYFNTLQQGMNDLPPADEQVRNRLQKIWQETPDVLHQRLLEVDPVSAARIHKNDPQRLVRALEVVEVSGKTLTELRAEPKKGLTAFKLIKIGMIPTERPRLHQQIISRFNTMLEDGFLQEVKGLMESGVLEVDMTSIRSVGYRQAWSFLQGEYDYDTFFEKGIIATRQLAKRQMTWLRKEADLHAIDPFNTSREARLKIVADLIESHKFNH